MAKRGPGRSPAVIGWREWLALPDLGIAAIKAKVDTGARSSSLHAFGIEQIEHGGGSWVRFGVHPLQRDWKTTAHAELPLHEMRVVRNPGGGGREELRPVVVTAVELMGQQFDVELTLTSRDRMGFRMLLGRSAVRGRFVVDPGRSYLAGRPPRPRPREEGG